MIVVGPMSQGDLNHWLCDAGEVDGGFVELSLYEMLITKSQENGIVLRPCQERFLHELIEVMKCAYEDVFQYVFDNPKESYKRLSGIIPDPDLDLIQEDIFLAIGEASAVLKGLIKEIRRLQQHQGLYPSHTAKREFHSLMSMALREDHERTLAAAIKMQNKICWASIHEAEEQIILAVERPTFQPQLKPWQQFLLDGAPGSGINLRENFTERLSKNPPIKSAVTSNSAFQIIPYGGMKLYAHWRLNGRDLKARCHEVSSRCMKFKMRYLTLLHRRKLSLQKCSHHPLQFQKKWYANQQV